MRTLHLPKFYRYTIYRFYTWRLQERDDTPIVTIVGGMTFVHCIQIFIVFMVLGKAIPSLAEFFRLSKSMFIIIFLVLMGLYYLVVYNKERWSEYIEEFQNETSKERRRRGWFVGAFTYGSILLVFAAAALLVFFD